MTPMKRKMCRKISAPAKRKTRPIASACALRAHSYDAAVATRVASAQSV
jgi:hypothetical protein